MGLLFIASVSVTRLNQEFRPGALIERAGRGGPLVAGIAFAFAWTPCVGPALGTILGWHRPSNQQVGLRFYRGGLGVDRRARLHQRVLPNQHRDPEVARRGRAQLLPSLVSRPGDKGPVFVSTRRSRRWVVARRLAVCLALLALAGAIAYGLLSPASASSIYGALAGGQTATAPRARLPYLDRGDPGSDLRAVPSRAQDRGRVSLEAPPGRIAGHVTGPLTRPTSRTTGHSRIEGGDGKVGVRRREQSPRTLNPSR